MELAVGYVFTSSLIEDLQQRGFELTGVNSIPGCHRFVCKLAGDGVLSGFELREVLEEELYFKGREPKDFHPFVDKNSKIPNGGFAEQPNSVVKFRKCLWLDQMESNDLKQYLSIRKVFGLCALWLECTDWERFQRMAKPDRIFMWNETNAGLIHLGPSSFDLVITKKSDF